MFPFFYLFLILTDREDLKNDLSFDSVTGHFLDTSWKVSLYFKCSSFYGRFTSKNHQR